MSSYSGRLVVTTADGTRFGMQLPDNAGEDGFEVSVLATRLGGKAIKSMAVKHGIDFDATFTVSKTTPAKHCYYWVQYAAQYSEERVTRNRKTEVTHVYGSSKWFLDLTQDLGPDYPNAYAHHEWRDNGMVAYMEDSPGMNVPIKADHYTSGEYIIIKSQESVYDAYKSYYKGSFQSLELLQGIAGPGEKWSIVAVQRFQSYLVAKGGRALGYLEWGHEIELDPKTPPGKITDYPIKWKGGTDDTAWGK